MPKKFIVIAIDGGAASGKSSTSRAIADRFNLLHVDTGAHYRAVTWTLSQARIDSQKEEAIKEYLDNLPLATEVSGRRGLIRINRYIPHENELRSAEVNQQVSLYSVIPRVRQFLLDYQRGQVAVAKNHHFDGVVMEGRDIGTTIFPDADLKIFLEADPAVRAERRRKEGQSDSIQERDRIDSSRKASPFKKAEDAITLDSTDLSLEEVVEKIAELVNDKVFSEGK